MKREESGLHSELLNAIKAAGRLTRVHWGDLHLAVGDRLVIRARNTTYEMAVVDVAGQLVEVWSDGPMVPGPTRCCLLGTLLSPGGMAIMSGVIALGGGLQLSVIMNDEEVVANDGPLYFNLTATQSVAIRRVGEAAATVILPTAGDA